jgi:hypothetical protein
VIDGRRVIAWVPYGREPTVSILVEYLRREVERHLIDEVWLYMNTDEDQVADRKYAQTLAARHAFVKLLPIPKTVPLVRRTRHGGLRPVKKQRRTIGAYRYMTDRNAVYVRFDDDIVYIHPDAVETLVRRKIEMPATLCCFPIIWNNAICSWWLQQCGIIPRDLGIVERPYCMDPVGWADGDFAVGIHRLLLDRIEVDDVESLFTYQDFALDIGQQFSVSCFAALGSYYAGLRPPGALPTHEEETHHTVHAPTASRQPNVVIGDALVAHYTFRPQQPVVHATDVLDRYRKLAVEQTT